MIEILKLNRELLKICRDVGIRMDDVQYIELYNDYNSLLAAGEKVSYIVAVLAEKYGVSERKVYALVKRFKSECNALIFGGGIYRPRVLNAPEGLETRCTGLAA